MCYLVSSGAKAELLEVSSELQGILLREIKFNMSFVV